MNNPLITVYITNYNYGRFIKTAIESVLNQTQQDFELIIIDDGSTDNSHQIIESYIGHPKIQIIYQQNKGLNVTNNIALRAANGKYLVRLDADDFFTTDALALLSGTLEEDELLGLVFPDYYIANDQGEIIEEYRRHDFKNDVSLLDQAAHGACTMIRIDFLKHLGGYNESFSCQDGYELWVKFVSHYKVRNINRPLFYYRQHGSNLTRNETRILNTRAKINHTYFTQRFPETSALAIIPVRDTAKALTSIQGKKIIDYKISAALNADRISHIVISSHNEVIEQYIAEHYFNNERVMFHRRDPKIAQLNSTLVDTVNAVKEMPALMNAKYDAFILLAIDFPFVESYVINDAVNTMYLFNSDSLISVRLENRIMFQHYGNGMHPILNQDKFTKLEREALYKFSGGISVVKKQFFEQHQEITAGKIGHIMIDQRTALGIFTEMDLLLAQTVASSAECNNITTPIVG